MISSQETLESQNMMLFEGVYSYWLPASAYSSRVANLVHEGTVQSM